MYNEKVVDYFMNPRNAGRIEDANGVGEVGNPTCGDVMKIYIKVNDHEVIEDVKFETFGCAAAIATSSMITEMIKGKTLSDAVKVTNKDVVSEFGELPPAKLHCSLLAQEGVEAAIADYFRRKSGKLPEGFNGKGATCSGCCGSCGSTEEHAEEPFIGEDHRVAD